MKRGLTVLACLCAVAGAQYYAISKWGIRHETLDLFDTARQRPVAVDVAVRRDYEMKAVAGYWKLPVAIISERQYRAQHRVLVSRQRVRRAWLHGRQHPAG